MNLSESLLSVLLDVFQEVRFLDCTVILFIILRRTTVLFPTWLHYFIIPPAVGSSFSTSSSTLVILFCFFFHPNKSKVIFHCSFDMHFQMILMLIIFSSDAEASLEKCLLKSFAHFLSYLTFCC